MGGSLVSGDGFGLTIITQTTPDRLHFLREMADRWAPHPLVATVYLPLGSSAEAVEAAARLNGSRPHLQLVLRAQRERGEAYPINELRNLAIAAAHTSHFLTLDVDLWPSEGLHAAFTRQSAALLANKRSALVVPAFAFYATKHAAEADEAFPRKASELPRSMAQLGHCVQSRGNCTTFYARSSPETHSSTNYPKWWNWTDVRRTFGIACMRSTRYEPYVIVPRLPSTPRYHEGFDGYGKNKIEFVIHLRYTGFRFDVLPFAFVTHMQHSKSELKEQWEDGATHHREKMDALFLQFAESLRASNKKMKKMPDCSASRAAAKGRSRKAR
ncbi:glycosyl-transferase for dystroglycan-domain-containing protein [Pavlovales sp. CCMP2436]|nr:glycosyl-transferase for dystroglycan-domain-containing protein [Pavlovales sp. CCMP2436]